MNNRIFLQDPNEHPLCGRWRRFDQAEAMEHLISGADPCPEWIRGLIGTVVPRGTLDNFMLTAANGSGKLPMS